jgi:hypothetical protein
MRWRVHGVLQTFWSIHLTTGILERLLALARTLLNLNETSIVTTVSLTLLFEVETSSDKDSDNDGRIREKIRDEPPLRIRDAVGKGLGFGKSFVDAGKHVCKKVKSEVKREALEIFWQVMLQNTPMAGECQGRPHHS